MIPFNENGRTATRVSLGISKNGGTGIGNVWFWAFFLKKKTLAFFAGPGGGEYKYLV